MSLSASRAMLRQSSRLTGRTVRRFESTTAMASEAAKNPISKASGAAKEAASNASQVSTEYKSKASEGLSRVTSSAGPAISGAAKSVGNALGNIGGRTGRLIALLERQIPSAIYYARVGLELSKLVFQGQKMAPPPLSTFQSYFQTLIKGIRNPSGLFSQILKPESGTPESVLSRIRNINSAQLANGGVILAEVLGFFTLGEILGRFKLVGYRGEKETHH